LIFLEKWLLVLLSDPAKPFFKGAKAIPEQKQQLNGGQNGT
jgi:hypothetical protein